MRVSTTLLLLIIGAGADIMAEPKVLYDFSDPAASVDWRPVNDGVMGGQSSSVMLATEDDTVLFTGNVSLENNGGFASIRSNPRRWELGDSSGIAIRVRGDGKAYKLNLRVDSSFDGINYRVSFATKKGEWQTWRVPFKEFRATFRGRYLSDAPALSAERVTSVGLLISDKQQGPFRLEMAWIAVYTDGD